MGFFKKKQPNEQPKTGEAKAKSVADDIFTEKYREELRQMGRAYLKKRIDSSTVHLDSDVDTILSQTSNYLKDHLARQVDLIVTRVSSDMTNQLNDRMNEFNRVSSESQELVIQSLSRNAQIVHEKYQQMGSNLQQIIASQEVMMATVFQDNKARVMTVQSEQDKALGQLKEGITAVQNQSKEAVEQLKHSAAAQSQALQRIYEQTTGSASQIQQSQAEAIESLNKTVDSLQEQQGRLQQMIDDSIAKQKTMMTELINEHISRIVEHYLIGALGERSDITKDLPNILEKMQENKQAMMDDMKL